MHRAVAWVALVALTWASPAASQDPDKRVTFSVGGGYTFALSEVRDHLGDGYNISAAVGVRLTESLWFQGEYSFNGLGEKQVDLPLVPQPVQGDSTVGPFFASMNMQYAAFSLVFKPKTDGSAKPYVIAGPGIYYRPVDVTTPGVGYVPGYCNPWWYWCYPGGWVPVDYIVGERSSTDVGFNFGGGVDFRLTDAASMYIEARYHYIWGPEVKDQGGKSYGKATGQFLPIIVGFRF